MRLTDRIHDAFHEPESRIYRPVQGAVWALILLSIAVLVVEALVPEGHAIDDWLRRVDKVILALFALELLLRVATYRPASLRVFKRARIRRLRAHVLGRLGYLLRPMTLIDVLAVLAFFPELRGLRALRLLRLLRTTRVFRYRNPFAIILQTLEENGLLFAFAFTVFGTTTLLGGVSMFLVEVRLNPSIDSVFDGIWWSLVTMTTVGFGDITPVTGLGRIIGAVLMIAGMFNLALFAGIVGSSLVRGMLSIREEQFRMSDHVNHVVVCGYDESTHLLLTALRDELDLSKTRTVIFDTHERPAALPPEFLWVQGDQTKESELDKVRLTHAAAVIVSGSRDVTPQAADARTILTAFTIRSFLRHNQAQVAQRHSPLYVVCEILDSENVNHARTAGADEVIETRKIGYSMIAHAIACHGTATTMSHVLMSGAHNLYIGKIPGGPPETQPFGKVMVELALAQRGGLVVGVRTPAGREVINPPKDFPIQPGTTLIYLAEEALLETPQ